MAKTKAEKSVPAGASAPAGTNPLDGPLHPQIAEALKVLAARQEDYHRALVSLDGQYLKALEASHDGDSETCQSVLAQVLAVRALF